MTSPPKLLQISEGLLYINVCIGLFADYLSYAVLHLEALYEFNVHSIYHINGVPIVVHVSDADLRLLLVHQLYDYNIICSRQWVHDLAFHLLSRHKSYHIKFTERGL
jgi:hypothetical protein